MVTADPLVTKATTAAPPSTAQELVAIREALKLSQEWLARLLDVSTRTVERWERGGAISPDSPALARLRQLQAIVALGSAVYTPDGFVRFMHTPFPSFHGLTAVQMVMTGQGLRVLAALADDDVGLGV